MLTERERAIAINEVVRWFHKWDDIYLGQEASGTNITFRDGPEVTIELHGGELALDVGIPEGPVSFVLVGREYWRLGVVDGPGDLMDVFSIEDSKDLVSYNKQNQIIVLHSNGEQTEMPVVGDREVDITASTVGTPVELRDRLKNWSDDQLQRVIDVQGTTEDTLTKTINH